MSTVKDITENLESIIGSLLPDYKALDYVWTLEKNHFRNNKQRYGVRQLASAKALGVNRAITQDQVFEIILTDGFKNIAKNDICQRDKIMELYAKMDMIAVEIHARKVNLPAVVLLVDFFGTEDPLFFEDENNLAILRGRFTIKYRSLLTGC